MGGIVSDGRNLKCLLNDTKDFSEQIDEFRDSIITYFDRRQEKKEEDIKKFQETYFKILELITVIKSKQWYNKEILEVNRGYKRKASTLISDMGAIISDININNTSKVDYVAQASEIKSEATKKYYNNILDDRNLELIYESTIVETKEIENVADKILNVIDKYLDIAVSRKTLGDYTYEVNVVFNDAQKLAQKNLSASQFKRLEDNFNAQLKNNENNYNKTGEEWKQVQGIQTLVLQSSINMEMLQFIAALYSGYTIQNSQNLDNFRTLFNEFKPVHYYKLLNYPELVHLLYPMDEETVEKMAINNAKITINQKNVETVRKAYTWWYFQTNYVNNEDWMNKLRDTLANIAFMMHENYGDVDKYRANYEYFKSINSGSGLSDEKLREEVYKKYLPMLKKNGIPVHQVWKMWSGAVGKKFAEETTIEYVPVTMLNVNTNFEMYEAIIMMCNYLFQKFGRPCFSDGTQAVYKDSTSPFYDENVSTGGMCFDIDYDACKEVNYLSTENLKPWVDYSKTYSFNDFNNSSSSKRTEALKYYDTLLINSIDFKSTDTTTLDKRRDEIQKFFKYSKLYKVRNCDLIEKWVDIIVEPIQYLNPTEIMTRYTLSSDQQPAFSLKELSATPFKNEKLMPVILSGILAKCFSNDLVIWNQLKNYALFSSVRLLMYYNFRFCIYDVLIRASQNWSLIFPINNAMGTPFLSAFLEKLVPNDKGSFLHPHNILRPLKTLYENEKVTKTQLTIPASYVNIAENLMKEQEPTLYESGDICMEYCYDDEMIPDDMAELDKYKKPKTKKIKPLYNFVFYNFKPTDYIPNETNELTSYYKSDKYKKDTTIVQSDDGGASTKEAHFPFSTRYWYDNTSAEKFKARISNPELFIEQFKSGMFKKQ